MEKVKEIERMLKKHEAVIVARLPICSIPGCGKTARYDVRTWMGQWANLCPEHNTYYGNGRLGIGFGQKLVTEEEVK